MGRKKSAQEFDIYTDHIEPDMTVTVSGRYDDQSATIRGCQVTTYGAADSNCGWPWSVIRDISDEVSKRTSAPDSRNEAPLTTLVRAVKEVMAGQQETLSAAEPKIVVNWVQWDKGSTSGRGSLPSELTTINL